jgi:hypothetical protein
MNNRIIELMEQSSIRWEDPDNGSEYNATSKLLFAELIIRECADIALREEHDPSDCILKHFGIER